jgi:hypothetical protein
MVLLAALKTVTFRRERIPLTGKGAACQQPEPAGIPDEMP